MAKVLCIEDEPDLREQIVEELDEAGYEVVQAEDGPKGLAAILEHQPDLVLSDVNMPGFSGHEVMKRVRAEHPDLAEMPFIFLTALAERNQMIEAKKMGVDDYLTKPVDFEILLATVEARLAQVARMTGFKQDQMIKLYQAMSKETSRAEDSDGGATVATAPPGDAGVASSKGMRVLIAAHEQADLPALTYAFETEGYECFVTRSGREVMTEFEESGADAIILAQNTIDLSASIIVKALSSLDRDLPPVMLLSDPERKIIFDLEAQRLFAKSIPLSTMPPNIVRAMAAMVD